MKKSTGKKDDKTNKPESGTILYETFEANEFQLIKIPKIEKNNFFMEDL